MTVRTRDQLNSDADTSLPDNTTSLIMPEDVRQRVKDLADSALLPEDSISADSIEDGTANKAFTAEERNKLGDIEEDADVTDAGNVGASIHGATAKTTPVDADTLPLIDSAASDVLKKVTWANIKATLKTYFDSLTTTLTNKRITPRIGSIASSSTPTPSANDHDQYNITALAAAATVGAPSGTPTDGQKLVMRIKDNGTARALSWNAIYRTITALPTTTVVGKTLYLGFMYNAADTKWDLVAKAEEA